MSQEFGNTTSSFVGMSGLKTTDQIVNDVLGYRSNSNVYVEPLDNYSAYGPRVNTSLLTMMSKPETYGGLTGGEWANTALGLAGLGVGMYHQNKANDLAEAGNRRAQEALDIDKADKIVKKDKDGNLTTNKSRVIGAVSSVLV